MKLSELLFPLSLPAGADDPEISAVVCHTEKIVKGALWFCIPGARVDPLPLLPRAARAGAAAAVVPRGAPLPSPLPLPVVEAADVREAAAVAFDRFWGSPSRRMRFFGVTGTNGKTSTALLLASALRASGRCCGYVGTVGCQLDGKPFPAPPTTMTTPPPETLYETLAAMADAGATDLVMEVSSHAAVQKRVAPLFFREMLFTNLSPEHLDFHRTMTEYALAKAEAFRRCGAAVVNAADPFAETVTAPAPSRVACGREGDGFRLSDVRTSLSGTDAVLHTTAGDFPFHLPVPGSFMAENALLAAAAALTAGVLPEDLLRAFRDFPGVPGRMELPDLSPFGADFSVMIDYAHTEAALLRLLAEARKLHAGRILLLFGCGGDRDRSKRAPMGRAAESGADFVFLTSDNARTEPPGAILRDVLAGMEKDNHTVIVSRRRAIETAVAEAQAGDLLILAGKGHETYEIRRDGTHPFPEKEILFAALKKRQTEHNKGGWAHEDPDPA